MSLPDVEFPLPLPVWTWMAFITTADILAVLLTQNWKLQKYLGFFAAKISDCQGIEFPHLLVQQLTPNAREESAPQREQWPSFPCFQPHKTVLPALPDVDWVMYPPS